MATVGIILYALLRLYFYVLIARMIISWIPLLVPSWQPRSLIAAVFEIVYVLTDPPIKAFGKIIPPINFGTISLDVAFIAVLIVVGLAQRLVIAVFF